MGGDPSSSLRLVGMRSLLEQALDRANEIVPPGRTLAVVAPHRADEALPQLQRRCEHVVREPVARGTGIAVFAGLAALRRLAPEAIVALTPTDRLVSRRVPYVDALRTAQAVATRLPELVLLLGTRASVADPELGYLGVGDPGTEVPAVHGAVAVVDRPPRPHARLLVATGALLDTGIAVASIEALWHVGRIAQPELISHLEALAPLLGTADEAEAMKVVYRSFAPLSLVRDVLAHAPARLAVMEVASVERGEMERVRSAVRPAPRPRSPTLH